MATDAYFHMIVQDVFSIAGRGTVVTGTVDSGTLKVGDKILVRAGGRDKTTIVAGIEIVRKIVPQANAGDVVGILLKGISKGEVGTGDELMSPGPDFTGQP